MSRDNQREWPPVSPKGASGTAIFQTPDVIQKSERSLAGPLRLGTAPGVGPRGAPRDGSSDFGMDRITPRGFDPMGTSDTRAPAQEESGLARKARGR